MSLEQNRIEQIARELYKEHRQVIDFIVEQGSSNDFVMAARQLFGQEPSSDSSLVICDTEFYFNRLGNAIVSFLPASWADALNGADDHKLIWPGCENWWAEYPLICWFELTTDPTKGEDPSNGRLRLFAEVGRLSDHNLRTDLISKILDAATEKVSFQTGAMDEGRKTSKFFDYKFNSKSIKDVGSYEEIEGAMKAFLTEFKGEFDAIGKALVGFDKFGTKAQ